MSIVAGVLYVTPPAGISGNLTVDLTITETGKYFMIIRIYDNCINYHNIVIGGPL